MTIYKCLENNWENLLKKINRIINKCNKYNLTYHFAVLETVVEKVTVIDYSNPNNIPASQFYPKTSSIYTDVVNFEFTMQDLKLGDFELVACIEHLDGANLIHVMKEGYVVPEKYKTVKSICEHCNSNRTRNKTVLLQGNTGELKQVGTTCLQEYTGIECADIVGIYESLHAIIIDNTFDGCLDSEWSPRQKYINTVSYLERCIELINTQGYKKEGTKVEGFDRNTRIEVSENSKLEAKKVIDFYINTEFKSFDTFNYNIKTALSQEYSKLSGFVAYAYISYQKESDKLAAKQAEKAGSTSQYLGNIGDKLEIELTIKKITITEFAISAWNHVTNYIHIMQDKAGNTVVWKTNKSIGEAGEIVNLKGTIKAHTEYNDIKQTELTRCKVLVCA